MNPSTPEPCQYEFIHLNALDICHQFGVREICQHCGETRDTWKDRDPFEAWNFMHFDDSCPGCQQIMNQGMATLERERNLFGDVDTVPVFTTITEDKMFNELAAEMGGSR
jgi:hypothetical protein